MERYLMSWKTLPATSLPLTFNVKPALAGAGVLRLMVATPFSSVVKVPLPTTVVFVVLPE